MEYEPFILLQDDEVTAHICNPPVFDDGGHIDIVCATVGCTATANVQNPDTAAN